MQLGKRCLHLLILKGGLIILGVDDNSEILGVPGDPDDLQECLYNFIHNGCNQPLTGRIGIHQIRNRWIHYIEVEKNRNPTPTQYKQRYYIRRGRNSVPPFTLRDHGNV